MGMISQIISDAKAMEAECIRAEEDAQKAYEDNAPNRWGDKRATHVPHSCPPSSLVSPKRGAGAGVGVGMLRGGGDSLQ